MALVAMVPLVYHGNMCVTTSRCDVTLRSNIRPHKRGPGTIAFPISTLVAPSKMFIMLRLWQYYFQGLEVNVNSNWFSKIPTGIQCNDRVIDPKICLFYHSCRTRCGYSDCQHEKPSVDNVVKYKYSSFSINLEAWRQCQTCPWKL